MSAFQVKAFDELVSDMVQYIVSHTDKVTDLSPGSIIRSYCEGAGLCLEELYVSIYLGFRRQLDQIQETIFSFARKSGVTAKVNVIFGRTLATPDAKLIPIGTRVKTNTGLIFKTLMFGNINSGDTLSSLVACESDDVGSVYNVSAGSIIAFVDTIEGVNTVTNPTVATQGIDKESDYQYKKRFQAYIEGLAGSNIAGIITAALSVEGITSASVYEYFPPVSNINARVYIDDGSSAGVADALVTEVQDKIDGDGSLENPGYRSAGVNVVATKPGVVVVNVSISISITLDVDSLKLIDDVKASIAKYINNLGVGADVIQNELIYETMALYGIIDCEVTNPSDNVSISTAQVARVGTITVVTT